MDAPEEGWRLVPSVLVDANAESLRRITEMLNMERDSWTTSAEHLATVQAVAAIVKQRPFAEFSDSEEVEQFLDAANALS